MTPEQIIVELERYENGLTRIHSNFKRTRNGINIADGDDRIYHQYVQELVDLYNDSLGRNTYSSQIVNNYQNGLSYLGTPSLKGVENILSIIRASLTRLRRNPELLENRKAEEQLRKKQNVFIIHGRDEAKWRELKDIIQTEFRLNPIILINQPDAGCKTIIEKFEHYAKTCSYAIAVFTPDDEVSSGTDTYLQARPNVIYELGWFCGRLGRENVMLLLKEGTSIFSDFGGIIQKRFNLNISEKIIDIRQDLVAANILPDT